MEPGKSIKNDDKGNQTQGLLSEGGIFIARNNLGYQSNCKFFGWLRDREQPGSSQRCRLLCNKPPPGYFQPEMIFYN